MSDHLVDLSMHLRADTPEDAVAGFVDLLTEKGLRNWRFRVVDPETKTVVGLYDGWGNPKDDNPPGPTVTLVFPALSTPIAEIKRTSDGGSTVTDSDIENAAEPTAH